jgi:hypothetical protein
MVCITNCAIGFALVGGTIATALVSKQDPVFQQYHATLEPEQKAALDMIANERLNLYIQGTLVGLVLVGLLTLMGVNGISPFANGCAFVALVLLTQYFYYILMPKSDWMLRHLKSSVQNEAWLRVYRHMSVRWHGGLLVGLLGFFLLGRGMRM